MSNVLLVAIDAGLERRIKALPGHRVIVLDRRRFEDLDDLHKTGTVFYPDVILIGESLPLDYALSYVRTMRSANPHLDLILVTPSNHDVESLAREAGISRVIEATTSNNELHTILNTASGAAVQQRRGLDSEEHVDEVEESRVIVVASPKGGVGKSTIAANLAIGLAISSPMSTVLLDLDVQFGDVGTLLDLHPAHTLADAFTPAAQDSLVLKTFLVLHPAGLYVLCGAESPEANDKVTSDQVRKLISQLSSQFGNVIVDTAAGIPEHTLAALEESSDIVLITTMDVSCLNAVRKEIDLLNQLGLMPHRRHVVLNMADRRSGMSLRDVENLIGMKVNVVVPRTDDVPFAGNTGEPILLKKKTGEVHKALTELVNRFGSALSQPTKAPFWRSRKGAEPA